MTDEQQWKRKQTQTERDGSGRWGGGYRTAVGMEGGGDTGRSGGAIKPRLAICLSDPSIEFALHCLFQGLVDEKSITINTRTTIDLERRRPQKARLADIVITELDSAPTFLINDAPSTIHPRIIALVPTHVASEYLCRLYRKGINICLWNSGLEAVLRTVLGSLRQRDNNIVYDETVENYFASPPCVESKIDNLTATQRFVLRRLRFSDELLCTELELTESWLDKTKNELLCTLEVNSIAEAISFAELYEVSQLSLDANPAEKSAIEREALTVISAWLEKSLTQPNPGR